MKTLKVYKIIFLLVLTLLILAFLVTKFLILYNNHLEPAYSSYTTDCNINNKAKQKLIEKGYVTPAQTSRTTNKTTGNTTITVTFFGERTEEGRIKDAKHEQCHLTQIYQNRINNCSTPIKLYLDELECSFAQDLDDDKYKKKYDDYMYLLEG